MAKEPPLTVQIHMAERNGEINDKCERWAMAYPRWQRRDAFRRRVRSTRAIPGEQAQRRVRPRKTPSESSNLFSCLSKPAMHTHSTRTVRHCTGDCEAIAFGGDILA